MFADSEAMKRQPNKRGKGEAGQAMVEFALVVPILLTVVFAAIEFGDAYWKYQQLSAAVSEGARKAIVSRNASDKSGTVTTAIRNAAPNLNSSSISVSMNPSGSSTWTAGSNIAVTATYPETISIVGIPVSSFNLTNTRSMRIEQ